MRFHAIQLPFLAPDGIGGSGGGSGAPSGAPAAGGGSPQTGSPAGGAAPTPISLSDDALIVPPGGKDPVKYSDFIRGYIPQSEWTKRNQALSREREEFEKRREAATQRLIEEARRIAALQGGGQQPADPLASIREAPYVDGPTLAGLAEAIEQRGLKPLYDALQQRDRALLLMNKRMEQMGKLLSQLTSRNQDDVVNQRISRVREQLGIPEDPEAVELLKDLYSAYEDDGTLDQEFPDLARRRLEGMRKLIRRMDKEEAERARRQLIPGRGGNGTPGQPLRRGYKSPDQLAEELGTALGLE
jgi:hypothetical protein